MDNIGDVDVLISGWGTPAVDSEVLQCAKQLKVHAHTGGSVASYVSKEEYERGIKVLSGNDVFAKSVAEGCLCYTLMSTRRFDEFLNSMRSGGWRLENGWNHGLIGKKSALWDTVLFRAIICGCCPGLNLGCISLRSILPMRKRLTMEPERLLWRRYSPPVM